MERSDRERELRLELLAVAGQPARATRTFAPHVGKVVLGRGRKSDVTVTLQDELVSRHHAQLEWRQGSAEPGGWWLSDLLSRGGLRLNGRDHLEPAPVRAGDLLELGRSRVLVELGPGEPGDLICAGCARSEQRGAPTPGLRHGRRWVCEACLTGAERRAPRECGGYREVAEIGAGAYGRVLLVTGGGRLAALKLSQRDPFGDPDEQLETEARFKREVQVLRAIDHPAVVRVYAAGTSNEGYWVALELMDDDLFRVVRRSGPVGAERAAQVGAELLSALSHLHARAVLHRDVKPNNVLVAVDGAIRLGDFGLCTSAGATKLTATRIGMGTLHYTPPEQLEDAHGVDARADVYGWGATLYYLLLGLPPYWWAKEYVSVVRAMLQEDCPSPHEIDARIPLGLSTVVARALARDPAQRFASADEALAAWTSATRESGAAV